MARLTELLGEIGSILNDLPDVFSTAQWGGRAYKLPNPNGNRKKPKLLAFVTKTPEEDAVRVVFKMPKDRSVASIERYGWVEPFEFGNWKKSGWVAAQINGKRQLKPLGRLLGECRAMFPAQDARESSPGRSPASSNPIVNRLDRVLGQARADGWTPAEDDS